MVYIQCDCGSDTFHINFIPPLSADAVCTECGREEPIGESKMERDAARGDV